MAFLQEVCHWQLTLRFQKPMPILVSSVCFMPLDQDVNSPLLLQHYAGLSVVHPDAHKLSPETEPQ